jgi:hypothetical protein
MEGGEHRVHSAIGKSDNEARVFQFLKRSGANSCRLLRQVCHSWAVPGEM